MRVQKRWNLGLTLLCVIAYLKKVTELWKEAGKSEEEIKKYQAGIQGYFTKKLAPNFKDLDFYTGESMDPDGM